MKTLIIGFAVIGVAVLSVLPSGLNWGSDVLSFLRGSIPIVAVFVSLILIFLGVSNIADRVSGKRKGD